MSDRLGRLLPLVLLAGVAPVLALRFGGYHVRHFGWAVLVLVTWACIEAARGRMGRTRSPFGAGAWALAGLTGWSAASIAWAEVSTHDAWVETARTAGYCAMFLLGGALLANARSFARFATLTGAGVALVTSVSLLRMLGGDAPLTVFVAGRLDWPLGYAPGVAAACSTGALLLLGSACAAEQRWIRTRTPASAAAGALAMAGATVCVGGVLLAQSRGALLALGVGVLISVVATPMRSSWVVRAGMVVGAMLVLRTGLAEPFQTQFDLRQAPFTPGSDEQALLAAAEAAARAAAVGVLGAALAVAVASWGIPALLARLLPERGSAHPPRASFVAAGVAAVAAAATLLVLGNEDASRWVSRQWAGCVDPPTMVNDPGSGRSHFANAGTGRCDYYRVALYSFGDDPLTGTGAGNFRGDYVRERRTAEEPRVAHSLPLSLLGELGLVGALLGLTALASVGWAGVRFVRSGPRRDAAFAGAIGAMAYWTAHASIDWLWQLPAVTLPMVALAGGLAACVSSAQQRARSSVALPMAGAALVGALALALPVTMADRQLRTARDPELQGTDPAAALEAARAAGSYDPRWAAPALVEAQLLSARGDSTGAARAASRAIDAEPQSWSVQWQAAELLAGDSAAEAARARARRLNPRLAADEAAAAARQRSKTPVDSLQNPDA